ATLGEGRVGGQFLGERKRLATQLSGLCHRVDQAPLARGAGIYPAADEEQLARSRRADRLDELPDPGVRIDEPELRGRHPERDLGGGDAQVACERELQPAADRVAVERRDGGV